MVLPQALRYAHSPYFYAYRHRAHAFADALMGLLLLEAMAMSGKGLRQLLDETMDEIGHFYYRRIDAPIENASKE